MIESKIDDLIKAINANTAALAALSGGKAESAPKAEKPARKAAPVVEQPKVEETPEPTGPSKEQVAKAIEQCLKAGKKDELVALIKGFGAGNATSLFAKGPEVAAQFIEAAEALLLGE